MRSATAVYPIEKNLLYRCKTNCMQRQILGSTAVLHMNKPIKTLDLVGQINWSTLAQ